jgi:ABC-type transport system involved in cytochrome c biogenesis permease subunit
VIALHQATAALYLAAGLAAALGLALPAPRARRAGVWLLGAGALLHTLSFLALHRAPEPPPLATLPAALSLMVWIAVCFFLALARRARLSGLVVVLAPAAFLGVFAAALGIGRPAGSGLAPSASWSHLHVLLSSAGLALLAVAGLAGLCFVAEHRRLKAKRPLPVSRALPSLEALDRVNRIALGAGFLLLTLGLVTGVLWVRAVTGQLWPGTAHASWTLVAWGIYAVLAAARFGAHQGARESALAAFGGFAFLLFAVVGIGVLGCT